mmetsp:Transcript_124154/g.284587  ORF Transcript_124154/g.284587 Transcript_124154/m.284587 type:complete len:219 (+) Transcript_124154:80-736(+)
MLAFGNSGAAAHYITVFSRLTIGIPFSPRFHSPPPASTQSTYTCLGGRQPREKHTASTKARQETPSASSTSMCRKKNAASAARKRSARRSCCSDILSTPSVSSRQKADRSLMISLSGQGLSSEVPSISSAMISSSVNVANCRSRVVRALTQSPRAFRSSLRPAMSGMRYCDGQTRTKKDCWSSFPSPRTSNKAMDCCTPSGSHKSLFTKSSAVTNPSV